MRGERIQPILLMRDVGRNAVVSPLRCVSVDMTDLADDVASRADGSNNSSGFNGTDGSAGSAGSTDPNNHPPAAMEETAATGATAPRSLSWSPCAPAHTHCCHAGNDGRPGSDGNGGSITVTYDPSAQPYLDNLHLINPHGPRPQFTQAPVAPLW